MYKKNEALYRNTVRRRIQAFIIVFALLCSLLPLRGIAVASGSPDDYLCGHVHDEACGYCASSAGTSCAHIHNADCAYVEGSPCTDIHIHDASCGCIEAVACNYVHTHDENCGYAEAVACNHVHNDSCGYIDPVSGQACNHCCQILGFTNHIPGEAISVYNAEAGETYNEICAALTETLPGMLACAEGDISIPVSWSCPDFSSAAGDYSFRAQLTNAHCVYAVADDALTVEVDENLLPFINVTVPQALAVVASLPEPITTLIDGPVTVSGQLPDGAYLLVEEVPLSAAQELLGQAETAILFAYDIKIMLPSDHDPIEYQPTADSPVIVIITPPQPIEAPAVEVVHIAQDEETGETTPQPVAEVTTTESGAVEFAAEGFSVYIGTVVNGTEITLKPGSGYKFYSDDTCNTEISGEKEISAATDIYVKANGNYIIKTVTVKNEDGTPSTAKVSGAPGPDVFMIAFPDGLAQDQIITVKTAVNAPGGTILSGSTPAQVAALFDVTATNTANTDNVTVAGGGFAFTVTLKNDLTLNGMITVSSGVTLTILSAGNHTITRGASCSTHLFSSSGGHLVLGSGSISNNTITYHFNTGDSETYSVGGTVPTSDAAKYVTYTTVSTSVSSTMEGALTIDGGAEFAAYSGTGYSATTKGNSSSDNSNLIKFIGGSVTMWGGVTLQNNLFAGNDTKGGGAINLSNGIMNMYGGTIRRCVNICSEYLYNGYVDSSFGDGGAMFLQGESAKLYIHDGTITECESDNSSAISLWNSSSLYLMGGAIHRNFAVGDSQYPPQAISAYNGASMYIYAGTISDNQGIQQGTHTVADVRVSTSGTNTLHLFGGTIGSIVANDNADNKIYVYAGQVGSVTANGQAQLIRYAGTPKTVTLPDAVQANGGQTVQVEVYEDGDLIESFSTTGMGTSSTNNDKLVTQLPAGTYEIKVKSVSMEKIYSGTVVSADVQMTTQSRTMVTPLLSSVTTNSVTLCAAGTGNDVDGAISYGRSDASGTQPTSWQDEPFFTGLTPGIYYFWVKAATAGGLAESVCTTPLEVELTTTVSIGLGGNILLASGGVYIIHPTITPDDYALEDIVWSVVGASSPDTRVVKNSDGSGTVMIAVGEAQNNVIQIEASLAGTTATASVAVAVGTSPSASMANATVAAGESVSWTMNDCSYRWQVLNNSIWQDTLNTSPTYTTSLDDVGKKLRLVMTTSTNTVFYSATVTVLMNNPTFTMTIPESVNINNNDRLDINLQVTKLFTSQSLAVAVVYDSILSCGRDDLIYTLYADENHTQAIINNGTIRSIAGTSDGITSGGSTIYYAVIGNPSYSGTYTDILTFTVSFNSGS